MALGAADLASYQAALKVFWPRNKLDLIFYRDHPAAAMINKVGDFYGEEAAWHNPVSFAPPMGGSADFAAAQAGKSTGREAKFIIPRRGDYGLFELQEEAVEASSNTKGAVEKLLQKKSKDAVDNLARNHARRLWGNTGGSRGRIGSISAGPPIEITLLSREDAVAFEIDMRLEASADDGTDAGHVLRAGTARVTKVDRDNGIITLDSLPGAWAANDYFFRVGDFQKGYTGFLAWLPLDRSTAFLSTPFLTVDRSEDPARLAGSFHDGRGGSIGEAFKVLARKVRQNGGGRPDIGFCSPETYEALEFEMENSIHRSERVEVMPSGKRGARIGFDALLVKSGNASVRVFEDIDCPPGVILVLERETWTFRHLNAVPHQARRGMGEGGGIAQASSDSVEWRWRIWGNLGTWAPGRNGVGLV